MSRAVCVLVVFFALPAMFDAQESTPGTKELLVDADGFERVTIAEEKPGHYSLTAGDARADLFITGEQLQYKATRPGFWMEQKADLEELNIASARVARLGDGWSVHILCRQPDRRIFVCTSFNRGGWDKPEIVGGVSIGGPSDSIDIRLTRQKAEELLVLIQSHFM